MTRRPSVVVTVVVVLLVVLGWTISAPRTLAADRQVGMGRDTPIGLVSLPGIGNAVLVAINSIQIDRDVDILSGDVVVNDASPGPVLGETELSLDRGVTTAAGYSLRADGVDIDQGAVVGGDGSNGTVRMHIEWDVSGFAGLAGQLESAEVILHTHRGMVDSLDTFFWAGGVDGDGLLSDSDFETAAEQIGGVVMPVPSTVDEGLTGPARGLEVRTSAAGNLTSFLEPQLALATPGVTPPLAQSRG